MSRSRRRARVARMRITIAVILLAALVIAVLIVGFKVRSVTVLGNSRHSAEEIQKDLIYDLKTSNSLYLSWKYRTARAEERAPYLNSVQAKLESMGKVRLAVSEKALAGSILYNGSYVCFDRDGLVLEMNQEPVEGIVTVQGVQMDKPVLYQKLPVQNAALLRTMLGIAHMLTESSLEADTISFDENLNMTASIGTIKVELGQDEYLEEKVANLATIYPRIADRIGTLKMASFTGRSEEIPFEEDEPLTEEETEGEGEGEEDTASANDTGDVSEEGASYEDVSQDNAPDQVEEPSQEVTGVAGFMVFDSSGTLRYDARVIGGQVVDAYGNPIDGCTVTEEGYVKDAYWNIIDPMTGTLAQ